MAPGEAPRWAPVPVSRGSYDSLAAALPIPRRAVLAACTAGMQWGVVENSQWCKFSLPSRLPRSSLSSEREEGRGGRKYIPKPKVFAVPKADTPFSHTTPLCFLSQGLDPGPEWHGAVSCPGRLAGWSCTSGLGRDIEYPLSHTRVLATLS